MLFFFYLVPLPSPIHFKSRIRPVCFARLPHRFLGHFCFPYTHRKGKQLLLEKHFLSETVRPNKKKLKKGYSSNNVTLFTPNSAKELSNISNYFYFLRYTSTHTHTHTHTHLVFTRFHLSTSHIRQKQRSLFCSISLRSICLLFGFGLVLPKKWGKEKKFCFRGNLIRAPPHSRAAIKRAHHHYYCYWPPHATTDNTPLLPCFVLYGRRQRWRCGAGGTGCARFVVKPPSPCVCVFLYFAAFAALFVRPFADPASQPAVFLCVVSCDFLIGFFASFAQ